MKNVSFSHHPKALGSACSQINRRTPIALRYDPSGVVRQPSSRSVLGALGITERFGARSLVIGALLGGGRTPVCDPQERLKPGKAKRSGEI